MCWLLLVYTIPSEPSRKRAYIWRELKKLGSVYLRDGVCVLPQRADARAALQEVVSKIHEFGGKAVLVEAVRLPAAEEQAIVEESQVGRAAEYRELTREAEALLEHVQREVDHREFTFAELEELEADLGKLRRWAEQISGRDYFGAEGGDRVRELLDRCAAALSAFLEHTFSQEQDRP